MQDAKARALCTAGCVAVPIFHDKALAETWYADRLKGNADGAQPQLYHTLIGWKQVTRVLLPHVHKLRAVVTTTTTATTTEALPDALQTHVATILHSSPVYAGLGFNPDAYLNTLRYLFFHGRCGIAVSIRGGKVAAFVPFVNDAYENTWHHKVKFFNSTDTDVNAYAATKAANTRRPAEDLLPLRAWWMNGGILCNVMPRTMWGDAYLAALRGMLDATCDAHVVSDVDFFMNKRDYPQLRRDGSEPYARFTGEAALSREVYSTYLPITSFYTGTDTADLPMPPCEDWGVATGQSFPGAPYGVFDMAAASAVPFLERSPVAVFRGSATGHGARLHLVTHAATRPDLVNAGVTGYNASRDKVLQASGSCITVGHRVPEASDVRADFISLEEQCQRFRYLIYVDGHAAASRYGTLMHTGSVILRVDSLHADDAGHLWLFPALRGARVVRDGGMSVVTDDADHMCIAADYHNLFDTVEYLNARPEVAARVAANAKARAPTRDAITQYWHGLLQQMHSQTACAPSAGAPWFSGADEKYARLGHSSVKWMSTE